MPPQQSLSSAAWISLLLLSLIWGASFLAIRVALDELPVAWVVVHRVGWAAMLLWVVVWIARETVPRCPRLWASFLVMGLLNNVVPFSLIAWGQLHIETGLTSILNASAAVFAVPVAALCFADERITPRRAVGTALGFLGVALAVGGSALATIDLRSLGQLAVLAGALSYAFAGVWARAKLSTVRPLIAAAGMLTGSFLVMLPGALFLEGPPALNLSIRTWMAISYFAVLGTAVAYLLYYRILALAGAANLLLSTLLIPPIAIVLGWIVLDEDLAPGALLGFLILASGLLVLDGRILAPRAKAEHRP
ncbi:MAG: DMT family transporter [Pseudomonadota bacterium]